MKVLAIYSLAILFMSMLFVLMPCFFDSLCLIVRSMFTMFKLLLLLCLFQLYLFLFQFVFVLLLVWILCTDLYRQYSILVRLVGWHGGW